MESQGVLNFREKKKKKDRGIMKEVGKGEKEEKKDHYR